MIIRISGLPGAGKTTLGKLLAEKLGYRFFGIDEYRNRYQDEVMALTELFRDIHKEGDNFILDSMGFNKRILWIFPFLKTRPVDIKLICEKAILMERIATKIIPENEYFPYRKSKREQYVEDFFADMQHKYCDIVIDTSHITIDVALKCALNDIRFYK